MTDASGRLSGLLVVGAFLLGGCSAPTEATEAPSLSVPRGELLLEFDEGLSEAGATLDRIQSSGTTTLRIKINTSGGGDLKRVNGRTGFAAKTPGFRAKGKTPVAVMVAKARGNDQLNPGDRPVRWGADVMLDAVQGTSATDNGANVLQRGLFDHDAQVKLQIDQAVPSCRVLGDQGNALVKADTTLSAEKWYRIHCELRNGVLSLLVGEPSRPGPREWTVPAEVGTINFRRSAPVSIGGKVDGRGRIQVDDTDQFNGSLDNVFMDIFG